MPAITHDRTTSGRRGVSAGFSAIATGLAAPAVTGASAPDPVLPLFAQFQALEYEIEPLERAGTERFTQLAALNAGKLPPAGASELWGFNYDDPALMRIGEEAERLHDARFQLADEIMAAPATTREGAAAKLRVALALQQTLRNTADPTYLDDSMATLITGALQGLEAGAVV